MRPMRLEMRPMRVEMRPTRVEKSGDKWGRVGKGGYE